MIGRYLSKAWVRWTLAALIAALIVIIVGGNGMTYFSMAGAVG